MASVTRAVSSGETPGSRLTRGETVLRPTPASAATSRMVALRVLTSGCCSDNGVRIPAAPCTRQPMAEIVTRIQQLKVLTGCLKRTTLTTLSDERRSTERGRCGARHFRPPEECACYPRHPRLCASAYHAASLPWPSCRWLWRRAPARPVGPRRPPARQLPAAAVRSALV